MTGLIVPPFSLHRMEKRGAVITTVDQIGSISTGAEMLKVFASRILRGEEGMNDYRLVEFLQTSQLRQEGFSL
jgi:hypothetical protein